MTMYFGNDRKCVTPSMAATCATVCGLTARTENVAHKLYLENLFLSPELFDDFHMKPVNCSTVTPKYSTVTQNQTEIPGNFGKTLKLKCGIEDQGQG